MNARIFRIGASLIFLPLLAGCIPGMQSGGGSGKSGESLSQQVARHEEQLQRMSSQVGNVEQVLPGQAEMWSQMQTMRQDLNAVQGKIDDLQRQSSGEGGGELAQLRDRVNRQEAVLRQMGSQFAINTSSLDGGGGGGSSAPTSAGSEPAKATNAPVDTATALYDSSIKLYDQRKYKESAAAFKDFSTTFPKHKMAGNARFWEGESYFEMKDYPRAALAYQEVIEKFPGSSKVQAAMLKQGLALQNAGKKDAAKERLNDLIKRYPGSPEASRAKQFLATGK